MRPNDRNHLGTYGNRLRGALDYEQANSGPSDAFWTKEFPVIATAKGQCWTDQDGLLRVMFHDGAFIALDDARAITTACEQVIDARPRVALVDFRKARGIAWAARSYFFHDARHLGTYTAVAVLVRSRIGQLVGQLLNRLLGTKRPSRMFMREDKAITWLKVVSASGEPHLIKSILG